MLPIPVCSGLVWNSRECYSIPEPCGLVSDDLKGLRRLSEYRELSLNPISLYPDFFELIKHLFPVPPAGHMP